MEYYSKKNRLVMFKLSVLILLMLSRYGVCLITIKGHQHEQRTMEYVGTGITIMWEEQLVNPSNEYITTDI